MIPGPQMVESRCKIFEGLLVKQEPGEECERLIRDDPILIPIKCLWHIQAYAIIGDPQQTVMSTAG